MDDVHVEVVPGLPIALKDILLTPGQIVDLGPVRLRSDGAITVRIVGYWARGAKQPWWLATSHEGPAREVLSLYDRRMTVEEQFRDLKGQRFGVKLYWTQFRNPVELARFLMLLAVALLIWILAGMVAAHYDPSLRMVCRKKGPRQSYVTIGLRILALEQPLLLPLTRRWVTLLLQPPSLRPINSHAVGGK